MGRTEHDWQRWGIADPYFAVVSQERFRGGQHLDEFFATGADDFARWQRLLEDLGLSLVPTGSSLDLGCGVGRYLKAYAGYFSHSTGVDVAPSMLALAERNLSDEISHGLVRLVHYDGHDLAAALAAHRFHFITSVGVLQHVRPQVGFQLLADLLDALEPGGIAIVQAPHWQPRSLAHIANRLAYRFPPLLRVRRRLQPHRPSLRPKDPPMEIHVYGADRVLRIAAQSAVDSRFVGTSQDARGRRDAFWVFNRPRESARQFLR